MKWFIFNLMFFIGTLCQLLVAETDEIETNQAIEFAKRYEIKERKTVPEWAQRSDKPLFTVAWLSDSHLGNRQSYQLNRAAFSTVRNDIKPDAVFITGDNCFIGSGELWKKYCKESAPAGMPGWERIQRLYRAILTSEIPDTPIYVLPGDNWYEEFSKVFGSDTFAFSVGGFRFIFASPDSSGEKNGCAVMSQKRWQWLRGQLAAYRNSPVIYLQHEPLVPPAILEADAITEMLKANNNVIGVLSGHLHVDLDLPGGGGWRQWCAPSIGRSHRPGFKVLSFYPDIVVGYSYEWQERAGKFVRVNKFQRLEIPEHLRGNLSAVSSFVPQDYNAMAPAERIHDASLDRRYHEVIRQLKCYAPKMMFFGLF